MQLNNILKQSSYLFVATFLCDLALECLNIDSKTKKIFIAAIGEGGLRVLLVGGFVNLATLVRAMFGVTWGVYCEIVEQKGSLHNLSGFWLSIVIIFVSMSTMQKLRHSIGYMMQLGSCLAQGEVFLAMQLGFIHFGLSVFQWIVMWRVFLAVDHKLWSKNKSEKTEYTG